MPIPGKVLSIVLLLFLALDGIGWTEGGMAAPLFPVRIGGEISVNGKPLIRGEEAGWLIQVTRMDGTTFTPPAQDKDGLNAYNWYIIDLPAFEAKQQPQGAKAGEKVLLKAYKNGTQIPIVNPSGGEFMVGASGSTTRIDLEVRQDE